MDSDVSFHQGICQALPSSRIPSWGAFQLGEGRWARKPSLGLIPSSWPEPLIQQPPNFGQDSTFSFPSQSLPTLLGPACSPSGEWRGSQCPAHAHCVPGPLLGTGNVSRCPNWRLSSQKSPVCPLTHSSRCSSNPQSVGSSNKTESSESTSLPQALRPPHSELLMPNGCRGSE